MGNMKLIFISDIMAILNEILDSTEESSILLLLSNLNKILYSENFFYFLKALNFNNHE